MGKKKKYKKIDSDVSDLDTLEALTRFCIFIFAFVVFVWLWISTGTLFVAFMTTCFAVLFLCVPIILCVMGIWFVCKILGAIFGAILEVIDKRINAPKQPVPIQEPSAPVVAALSTDDRPYPPVFPAAKQQSIFDDFRDFINHRDDWALIFGGAVCLVWGGCWIASGLFLGSLAVAFLFSVACHIIGALILRSVNNKRRARQSQPPAKISWASIKPYEG
jgi:hypothetical protein